MTAVTPEQLHEWYMQCIASVPARALNQRAGVPYDELTDDQKYIDEFMAQRVNDWFQNRD